LAMVAGVSFWMISGGNVQSGSERSRWYIALKSGVEESTGG
jgi:hypothetical protein